jgi:hypothetical protein
MNGMAESIEIDPEGTSSFDPHFQQKSRSREFRVVQF